MFIPGYYEIKRNNDSSWIYFYTKNGKSHEFKANSIETLKKIVEENNLPWNDNKIPEENPKPIYNFPRRYNDEKIISLRREIIEIEDSLKLAEMMFDCRCHDYDLKNDIYTNFFSEDGKHISMREVENYLNNIKLDNMDGEEIRVVEYYVRTLRKYSEALANLYDYMKSHALPENL